MQRIVILVIITLFGIAPIGIVDRSASAQDTPTPTEQIETCEAKGSVEGILQPENEGLPWYGVCRPILLDETSSVTTSRTVQLPEGETITATTSQAMELFAVKFKDVFAATEYIRTGDAEFMAVLVKEGNFALDVDPGSPQVLVSTSQDHIETLMERVDAQPYYETTGLSLTVNGEVCTQACPVSPDVPVLLVPGDVMVAEKGGLCIFCLLNGFSGLLEVSVLRDSENFTWIREWDNTPDQLSAFPSTNTEPAVVAWAFLNPAGRCDH